MRKKICVSFSGGETSALMAKLIRQALPTHEIVFVFANTGQEDERTLIFADRCDREFGLNLVWVEAVVNPEGGKGTRHRIVNFATASRKGEPFEAVIAKYGLPGPGYTHCNRELKLAPITSYLRSIGWDAGSYKTAIGIRADEMDRMSIDAKRYGAWYPLVGLGVTKADVRAAFDAMDFELGLPEHLGNCTWCWKKTKRKHLLLARDHPEVFDFPIEMERRYSMRSLYGQLSEPRKMFRGYMTAQEIIQLVDNEPTFFDQVDLDKPGGCGDSCEVFADEMDQNP